MDVIENRSTKNFFWKLSKLIYTNRWSYRKSEMLFEHDTQLWLFYFVAFTDILFMDGGKFRIDE